MSNRAPLPAPPNFGPRVKRIPAESLPGEKDTKKASDNNRYYLRGPVETKTLNLIKPKN